MRKIKVFLVILILAGLFFGCATASMDMAYSNRGFEELSKNNYEKAEEYLERALAINPDNAYALLNMGVVYQNTGRLDKAREMYNRVIELNRKAVAEKSNKDWAQGKDLNEIAKKNLETF